MGAQKENLPYINGLRGIAAFWVLIAHCMIWGGWSIPHFPSAKLAVDLFIVISGFLMVYLAKKRESVDPMSQRSTWIRFYIRRFFRLAPVFYFSLVAAALLSDPYLSGKAVLADAIPWLRESGFYHPRNADYSLENILLHASFVFGVMPNWSHVALPDWSLALEMQFYLIFPVLYLALRRFGSVKTVIPMVLVCVYVTIWLTEAKSSRPGVWLFPEPSFILMKLPVFLVGMLIAEASFEKGLQASYKIALYVLALLIAAIQPMSYQYYGWDILWLMAPTALIIAVSSGFAVFEPLRKVANPILGNRFMVFMSEMSYSVYLVHGIFIGLIGGYLYTSPWFLAYEPPIRVLIFGVMVTVASYGISVLIYRFVEKPGIRLGSRISPTPATIPRLAP